MTRWKIWEYQLPLHHVLPASGEQDAIRSGYLIQRSINGHTSLTELAPLESYHGVTKLQCLEEFIRYMRNPATEDERHSVTQLAIDLLDPQPVQAKTISCNALVDLRQNSDPLQFLETRCVKIKMGRRALDIEIRDLLAFLQKLPSHIKIRIDANRQWGVDELIACAESLSEHRLDYFEEPLNNPMHYINLSNIPIALDESMQHKEVHHLLGLPNVVAAVIKPSVLGGLNHTQVLLANLQENNIRAILSSTFESSLTLWAFGGLANSNFTHGLGTLNWFTHPLFKDSLKYNSSSIQLTSSPPKYPMNHCLKEIQI